MNLLRSTLLMLPGHLILLGLVFRLWGLSFLLVLLSVSTVIFLLRLGAQFLQSLEISLSCPSHVGPRFIAQGPCANVMLSPAHYPEVYTPEDPRFTPWVASVHTPAPLLGSRPGTLGSRPGSRPSTQVLGRCPIGNDTAQNVAEREMHTKA